MESRVIAVPDQIADIGLSGTAAQLPRQRNARHIPVCAVVPDRIKTVTDGMCSFDTVASRVFIGLRLICALVSVEIECQNNLQFRLTHVAIVNRIM